MTLPPMTTALDRRLALAQNTLPAELRHPAVLALLQLSLAEDLSPEATLDPEAASLAGGDVTSQATLPPEIRLAGRITAKAAGVAAGLPVAAAAWQIVDSALVVTLHAAEGSRVQPGQLLAEVSGPGAALLAGERTALNFLGRLSGIATLTRTFVEAVAGTRAVILDTRKTAPGARRLDKYAVKTGGGQNHRSGLYDMALVKDNHIDGAGGIGLAVARLRQKYGADFPIEVEVKNLDELAEALRLNLARIMLDNMDPAAMRRAVELTAGRTPLEASGNVSLSTIRAIAETGVDYISIGALTHSAPALDVSLRLS
jgi:nicotinate-nucleotide pyrophosphorylase (carboxylating)